MNIKLNNPHIENGKWKFIIIDQSDRIERGNFSWSSKNGFDFISEDSPSCVISNLYLRGTNQKDDLKPFYVSNKLINDFLEAVEEFNQIDLNKPSIEEINKTIEKINNIKSPNLIGNMSLKQVEFKYINSCRNDINITELPKSYFCYIGYYDTGYFISVFPIDKICKLYNSNASCIYSSFDLEEVKTKAVEIIEKNLKEKLQMIINLFEG